MGSWKSWRGHASVRGLRGGRGALRWVGACLGLLGGVSCAAWEGDGVPEQGYYDEEGNFHLDEPEGQEVEAVGQLRQAQMTSPALEPAPGGLRMLTREQYVRTVGMLLGADAQAQADTYAWDGPHGGDFVAVASFQSSVTGAGPVAQISVAADNAAREAVAYRGLTTEPLAEIDDCTTLVLTDPNERAQCYQRVAGGLGRIAFRLPLLPEQLDMLVDIAIGAESNPESGQTEFDSGLHQLLSAILQGPGLLYSVETGDTSLSTPRALLPHQLMTRMALTLMGRAPTRGELVAAQNGALSSAAAIKVTAEAMLATPEAEDAFWDIFQEWYLVDHLETESRPSFPNFTQALKNDMVEEARLFAVDHVFGASPLPFPQIYASQRRFITPLLDSEIYTQSNIGVGPGWTLVDFNSHHNQLRAGVLTLPAFLTVLAADYQTKIVSRGKFVWERVLCGEDPGFPPGGVGAVPDPVDPDGAGPLGPGQDGVTTWRMLIAAHASGGCASCHRLFDPGGYALENFDQIGAYRTHDFDGLGGPIFAETDVVHPRDSTATQTVLDGLDLGKLMAQPGFLNSNQFIDNTAECQITQLHEALLGERMQEDGSDLVADTAEFQAIKAAVPGYPQFLLTDFLAEFAASDYFTTVGASRN